SPVMKSIVVEFLWVHGNPKLLRNTYEVILILSRIKKRIVPSYALQTKSPENPTPVKKGSLIPEHLFQNRIVIGGKIGRPNNTSDFINVVTIGSKQSYIGLLVQPIHHLFDPVRCG